MTLGENYSIWKLYHYRNLFDCKRLWFEIQKQTYEKVSKDGHCFSYGTLGNWLFTANFKKSSQSQNHRHKISVEDSWTTEKRENTLVHSDPPSNLKILLKLHSGLKQSLWNNFWIYVKYVSNNDGILYCKMQKIQCIEYNALNTMHIIQCI